MQQTSTITQPKPYSRSDLGHIYAATWTAAIALATVLNLPIVQLVELQSQTLFFQLRGSRLPPVNIVILAIDEPSLAQGQIYRTNPSLYPNLEPLQSWPWRRVVYAQAINKLIDAGAIAVGIDILFADQSSHGIADDTQLAVVLRQRADKVTLVAEEQQTSTREGSVTQLLQPVEQLQTVSVGLANLPIAIDEKIHSFRLKEAALPSFSQEILANSRLKYPVSKGSYIHFYGGSGTFEQIPFWHVLDSANWNSYLKKGAYFQGKIVLVGGTAQSLQDYHATPFGLMSGVEIHANAIATLLTGRAIAELHPDPLLRGTAVFGVVGVWVQFISTRKRGMPRLVWSTALATTWTGICYISFTQSQLILPVVPAIAIALCGLSYFAVEVAAESKRKHSLRNILARHASSSIVQEIIRGQDDLQDLLQVRSQELFGVVLGGRYKIIKVLGSGGFGETYTAEDTQRPGNPLCVVKQLKPTTSNPEQLQMARRLFRLEAATLQKLGVHNQIPQLYAYFEENEEFYLVQELIVGHPLSQELKPKKPLPEAAIIQILKDLLHVLEFVHSQGVIHRDIKPGNVIRRDSDNKLVLIDFGAVKEVAAIDEQNAATTIGTSGYAPSEQMAGMPRLNSDIYALGMMAIKALTGLSPHELDCSSEGELTWMNKVEASSRLIAVLQKMTHYNFNYRYQSAAAVTMDLP